MLQVYPISTSTSDMTDMKNHLGQNCNVEYLYIIFKIHPVTDKTKKQKKNSKTAFSAIPNKNKHVE